MMQQSCHTSDGTGPCGFPGETLIYRHPVQLNLHGLAAAGTADTSPGQAGRGCGLQMDFEDKMTTGGSSTAFPYIPRRSQIRIMKAVFEAATQKRHLILESPTGSGKTVSVLSALLESRGDRKILYLTRTNSQQKQVMKELRMISGRMPVFGIAVQGRNNSCLLAREDEEMSSGTPEELSSYCSFLKERTKSENEGCSYYYGLMKSDPVSMEGWMRRRLPDAEELAAECTGMHICPYELSKSMLSEADVVTAPYIYFFDPFIRRRLLEWMGVPIERVIVVLDEAHNLPDYLREIESVKYSVRAAKGMSREAEEYGDPEVTAGMGITDLSETVQSIMVRMASDFVLDDDGLVPEMEFETSMMEELKISSRGFATVIGVLTTQGEFVRDMKLKNGRLPRSYIRSFGDFLRFWIDTEPQHYVKLVNGGENPSLEAYCMDPSLAALPLLDTFSSIHMSGTMGSLDDYRTLLGLPEETIAVSVPSDFPPENRRIVYVDDVTTRYETISRDAGMIASISGRIVDICSAAKRSSIVFLPSYNLLESLLSLGIERRLGTTVLVERKGMGQSELMESVEKFKSRRGSVFLSVMGGRISEGLDFPDETLEMVVIVGIPYPKPTAKQRALVNYYDILYRKGWDFAVRNPAVRRLIQASGRMIRSETDRGIAVVLDKRLANFREVGAERVDSAAEAVRSFFSGGGGDGRINK